MIAVDAVSDVVDAVAEGVIGAGMRPRECYGKGLGIECSGCVVVVRRGIEDERS